MSFRWIMLDSPSTECGTSPDFGSQADAEAWMGEQWRVLLEQGALAARLVDGDDEVYTMKLTEQ